MPASPSSSAAKPAAASFERWLLLGFCALISLGIHAWLVLGMHVSPGQGRAGGEAVRAKLRAQLSRVKVETRPALPLHPKAAQFKTEQRVLPKPASTAPEPAEPLVPAQPSAPVSAGSPGWPVPDYVPAEYLSIRPNFLVEMNDEVFASLDAAEAGQVVLSLLVSAEGEVDEVVVESSELSPAGTQAFVDSLQRVKLSPGMFDGDVVAARWRLEFNFSALPVSSQAGQLGQ